MHQPSDSVTQAFRKWKADLVDLTTDNPLLFFRADRNSLRLVLPAAGELLHQLTAVDAPRPFRLARSATPHETGVIVGRDDGGAEGAVLRALRQRARLALDEQGVHILYVTFGNLSWTSSKGEAGESPILIQPVSLNRATTFADYTLSLADRQPDLGFNPALAIKLKQDYQTDLQDIVGSGAASLDDALEQVRDSIADHLDWTVSDVSYLTLLPFAKYALYDDLDRHTDEFKGHPVIRAIAGDAAAIHPPKQKAAPESPAPDGDSWQVLDADQSQRAAIATVHGGDSVVIQGPPGTGKSQTITNLIAESLGRNKTVLFVSEKKAALNVVAQRLAALGLGDYCLELHDDALDETGIVEDLANRGGLGLPRDESIPPHLLRQAALADAGELADARRELDAYYEALCADTTPFGGSTYDAIGQLAHLANAPLVKFDYDPASAGGLTAARLAEFEDTLADLLQVAPIVLEPDSHPWRHVNSEIVHADPVTRYRLGERLKDVTNAAETLLEEELAIRGAWGLPPGATLDAATRLRTLLAECAARGPVPVLPAWFEQETWDLATGLTAREQANGAQIHAQRDELLARYGGGIFDEHLVSRLEAELLTKFSGILDLDPTLVDEPETQPLIQVSARFAAALVLAAMKSWTGPRAMARRNVVGVSLMARPPSRSGRQRNS